MSLQISRRAILATTVGGLTAALAGCMGASAENPPREGPDPFYIENYNDEEHEFSVIITRERDGKEIISGSYQVPANHGVTFSDVGALGETYRLAVTVDNLTPLTRDWNVSECPDKERGSNVNMAGAFFVRADEMGFAQNQCGDQQVGASSELTYVAPSEVALDN